MQIEQINANETLSLRQSILRPNSPLSECMYEGDDENTTVHLGAIKEGVVVGIVSIYQRPCPDISTECGFQFRAMATALSIRGQGVGFQLLKAAQDHAKNKGAKYLWANARSVAIDFYKKAGYSIYPDKFEIQGVGPHYLISKYVA